MSYEAELQSHYAGVRQRLRRASRPAPQPRVPHRFLVDPNYVAPLPPAPVPEPEDDKDVLTAKDILNQTAQKHNLTVAMMLGHGRSAALYPARREAVARMSMELGMSLAQIGRRMSRDHTTILHTIRVESLTNKALREAYGFRSQNRDAMSAECIRLRAEGMRKSEICRRLGVTKGKLDYALRYKSFPQAKHGEN